MSAVETLRDLWTALARQLPGLGRRAFSCGDCERSERCALPPNDACIAKAAQIARDGEPSARRTTLRQC